MRINHFAICAHLAGLLLVLPACWVDGHYVYPDEVEPPIEDYVVRLGGSGIERSGSGNSIAVALNGDLVLVGSFTGRTMLGGAPILASGPMGTSDMWVARYRSDGSHVWSVGMGSVGSPAAVAVDTADDVYVAGFGFVMKLAGTTGAFIWERTFTDQIPSYANVLGIASVDAYTVIISAIFSGTVDFGGQSYTSAPVNGHDCALAAYDSSTGIRVWSNHLASTGGAARCNVVGVDGDVVATGGFAGTSFVGTASGERDFFVARFRGADGANVWSMKYGGVSQDTAYALTTDESHIFVAGQFAGTMNLGSTNLVAAGGYDAFAVAYRANDGTPVWSQRFGGVNDDEAVSIAATSSQLAITISFKETTTIGTEHFMATAAIDPGEPSPVEGQDVVIARLEPFNGVPSRAWHLGNTEDRMALTFADRQLAGSGTFGLMTSVFGTTLTSIGSRDIATFRVDLDRAT